MKKRLAVLHSVALPAILLALATGCGQRDVSTTETRSRSAETGDVEQAASATEPTNLDSQAVVLSLALSTRDLVPVDGYTPKGGGTLALPLGNAPVDVATLPEVKAQVKVKLPDGSTYVGEAIGTLANGKGTLVRLDGTRLQGLWRDGRPYRVTGTWIAPDGSTEIGNMNYDGSKCGGSILYPDGREYTGDWKIVEGANDRPDGVGTMEWPDGSKYTGHFVNGQMDGAGKMTLTNGVVQRGSWKQGELVEPAP
jgi:hypothetical protein